MPDTLDALTGLLNIQGFLDQLDSAARSGNSLVLVVMDLDHFMAYNSQYGHQSGDEWIKAASSRFAQAFEGEGSIIARYGGDEFMAVVPARDLFEVYEKAEALRQRIESEEQTLQVDGQPVSAKATLTMGLASLPGNATDMNDLIEKGKEALRRAKAAGGNQVVFYQETDTLTGLLNKHASQRALGEALAQAKQKNESVSVFQLDIDRFKELNDEYGHRAGDEILQRLGHILQTNFKDLGMCGRIAGDEFIVILPGQRADSAFILAEEVRRLVDDSEITVTLGQSGGGHGRTFNMSFHISGGIASSPNDATELVDLLRKAGEALYRSKQTGRNRISLPASAQMVTKTSYYTQIQLERLSALARKLDKTEAFLLREALDELLRKYGEDAA